MPYISSATVHRLTYSYSIQENKQESYRHITQGTLQLQCVRKQASDRLEAPKKVLESLTDLGLVMVLGARLDCRLQPAHARILETLKLRADIDAVKPVSI